MDYSTLSDDELDRLIAERVGYRVEMEGDTGCLYAPTGERQSIVFGRPTENKVWEEALSFKYDGVYRRVPEYSTDLNAATQLFKQTSEREDAALRYEDGGWACEIEIEGGSVAYLYSDELEPARVICLTWLQWDDIRNRS